MPNNLNKYGLYSTMNSQNIKKILLFFCISIAIFFTGSVKSFASDYQYKVLDPKYNPQAEELLNGTLSNIPDVDLKEPKQFNFGDFFAIFALVVFPIIIVSLAVKTLKEIKEEIPGIENQNINNITIEEKSETPQKKAAQNKKTTYTTRDGRRNVPKRPNNKKPQPQPQSPPLPQTQPTPRHQSAPVQAYNKPPVNPKEVKKVNPIRNNTHVSSDITRKTQIRPAVPQKPVSQQEKLPQNANISISRYFSSPKQKAQNPMLLNTSILSKNKGLCLVEYNKKYSLIGYINNEIFMLNQFDTVQTNEIRSRLSESVDSKDRYIVRLGDYKALVEVTDTRMKLLLEL